jgi:molecular chaperone IbpA
MATFDFTPLFRSTVGFDRMTRLMDSALQHADQGDGYPPYNIESVDDDRYRITLAVSGFGSDDLELTAKEGTLVVQGRHKETATTGKYLHRGIAGRRLAFTSFRFSIPPAYCAAGRWNFPADGRAPA